MTTMAFASECLTLTVFIANEVGRSIAGQWCSH